MWQKISEDIPSLLNINKTPYQCENRYKTVIKKMKKAIDNNKKTGRSKMEVEYEEELGKIVAKDDSILPEVLVGQGKVIKPKIGMENGSSEINENKSALSRKIFLPIPVCGGTGGKDFHNEN
ncbi:hypothetical protein ABEB36_014697 [Hypothenemus hampei]|uniref:Myb-like domain-containing protein n=1 Tax=Hypothenemus hampei TaxID=57062 RepID=A0ABD1E2V2_HYPHA